MKQDIALIVDDFTSENPNYKVYELYIDKIMPDSIISILFAGEKSLTCSENSYFKQKSIIHCISNGKRIDIYSGFERYIDSKIVSDSLIYQHAQTAGIGWTIIDVKEKIIIEKDGVNYPFIPLPLKITVPFAPPVPLSLQFSGFEY
ncbi:MAG: hypothetical protein FWF72_01100 [Paludibacter sp.]|nr:hypothetical protein [Paludibacter sp.]